MRALSTRSFPNNSIRFIVGFLANALHLSARTGSSVLEIRETKKKGPHQVFLPALALVVLCLMSVSTQAASRLAASMNGAQETPPNASPATGYGSVILSDDQTTITSL